MATPKRRTSASKVKRTRSTATQKDVASADMKDAVLRMADLIEKPRPVLEMLESVASEQKDGGLAEALMGMRQAIRAGASLADAMARYPVFFASDLVERVRGAGSSKEMAEQLRQWAEATGPSGIEAEAIEAFKRGFSDRVIKGSSIVEALALESCMSANPQLAGIIRQVQETVTGDGTTGATLSEAFALFPEVFDEAYINHWRNVEAGKVTGEEAWSRYTSTPNEELLTLDQAVQFLGSSKPTVYRLLAQGELNGLKVGRQWRFRKADLIAYMERKPATVAASSVPDIDAEIEFFQGEAERLGVKSISRPEEKPLSEATGDEKIVRLVNGIFCVALKSGASDIHIEPMRQGLRLRYRYDGVLHVIRTLPQSVLSPLLGRLKVMADLDVMERRLPQDGRILIQFEEQEFTVFVSCCPTQYGESMVLRIVMSQSILVPLENLGMAADHQMQIEEMMSSPNGLLAFTGPHNSGKTTVLYSCLGLKNDEAIKVVTIEDPVECSLPFASQTHVNNRVGLTYATAMNALLRQDPDIIMIGQVNDFEVAVLAFQAALTGHLVLTAMDTFDATSFLTRIMELGIEPFLLSASVVGIVSQRLLRRVCSNCKEEYTPPRELLLRFGHDPDEHPDVKFYHGTGCEKCRRTGYKGRFAIFEVLQMNEELATLVLQRASHAELKAAARKNGMRTIEEDGFLRCKEGLTTPEEVMRAVFIHA